jgi:hypothetical protein
VVRARRECGGDFHGECSVKERATAR